MVQVQEDGGAFKVEGQHAPSIRVLSLEYDFSFQIWMQAVQGRKGPEIERKL